MDFYSISSLKLQSESRHVTPVVHISMIPPPNQSLFWLLNAACLAEKQQIPILYIILGLTPPGLENISAALEASTQVITPPTWLLQIKEVRQEAFGHLAAEKYIQLNL